VSGFATRDGAPAGDLTAPGELAAAPFVIDVNGLPEAILVARDIAKGTRIVGLRRQIDPPMDTPLPTLPNPITIVRPAASTSIGMGDEETSPATDDEPQTDGADRSSGRESPGGDRDGGQPSGPVAVPPPQKP
jgi:hypothetical protein